MYNIKVRFKKIKTIMVITFKLVPDQHEVIIWEFSN